MILRAAAGVALGLATSLPAQAQFAAPYPPLIVVPPPAPYTEPPKPALKPPAPAKTIPAPDAPAPDQSRCYQGRTRIC
jgi:hypothetical protein